MDFDWKAVVRTVAPALATALGTPMAGVATKVIADVLLGGSPDATEADLELAVRSASPDQLIELKKAGLQFDKDMASLGVDLVRLSNEDRASARQREVEARDYWTPRILAMGITLGFFGVLLWIMSEGVPEHGGDALLVMLGSLGTAWTGVVAYYFGSTAGSARKTDLLARQEGVA